MDWPGKLSTRASTSADTGGKIRTLAHTGAAKRGRITMQSPVRNCMASPQSTSSKSAQPKLQTKTCRFKDGATQPSSPQQKQICDHQKEGVNLDIDMWAIRNTRALEVNNKRTEEPAFAPGHPVTVSVLPARLTSSSMKMPMHTPMRSSREGFQ
eukprot:719975-Pelagomonas_calceolata.AAC.4